MKRDLIILGVVIAATATCASAGYSYAGQWGSEGGGPGEFREPCGLGYFGVAGGIATVYVVDRGNWRVEYFTGTGSFLGWFGGYGQRPGEFRWPMGLEVSPGSGDVYIADMMNDNVSIFTGNGSLIGTFSCPAAADVAIAPDNTYLYVTSGSYGNNCVYMCDIYGNVLGSWGHEGSGPGEFNDPCGVAVAPNGDVYVSDTNNDRIQYFTYDGSFLGMWGSFGTGEGQFARPWGLSVDCYSRVFVADHKNSRVQYFTSNGNFLGIWGSYGSGNGEFIGTDDVVLTPDAFVAYVSDYGNHRIQYFYENAGGDGGANPGTLVSISPTSLGKIKALYK